MQYARLANGSDYKIDYSTGLFVRDGRGKLQLLGTLDSSVEDIGHDLTALDAERHPAHPNRLPAVGNTNLSPIFRR